MDGNSGQPYRVLARKYRPSTFDDLIGQEAMVRTLTNAFAAGRIAQAYMLTGVRGVGKTTTARIIARALNYTTGDDPEAGPTIVMPEPGVHCEAIIESRHPDVVEMDAASHTGIDDIREIIESTRYRPVSARFKVYIIDEVHMLSKQAFNGLLKTLEEPPEHARFIFATTEIRKVPITVLSRCQRFDLRRVEPDRLMAYLATIAEREGAVVESGAVAIIARAAEGSVRDGLSLLDQAIALGRGSVSETDTRSMLGLADRARIIDLFEAVMRGDAAGALDELRSQYDAGADPQVVLADLAEFVNLVTRAKISSDALGDPTLSPAERDGARSAADGLSMATLARTWSMLLKGLGEVEAARRPVQAAEMVLIRMAYTADLPTPGDLVKALASDQPPEPGRKPASSASGDAAPSPVAAASADVDSGYDGTDQPPESAAQAEPLPVAEERRPEVEPVTLPESFEDAVRMAGDHDIRLADALERTLRPVSFEQGRIEITMTDEAPADLANRFAETLRRVTGKQWVVAVTSQDGGSTVREAEDEKAARLKEEIEAHPVVRKVKDLFPGAEVTAVRDLPGEAGPAEDEDESPDARTDLSRRA